MHNLQKAKAIRRDTQAKAVVWAAQMIPKLTQGCTQKTKYHKTKKKQKMRSKEMEQKTVAKGDT